MAKIRILIIEDESIVALDLATKLENQGYEVTGIVDNGTDALMAIENEIPDLVLVDITIKGTIDGIQTAEAINKIADIPVIYISALSDHKTLERAKATTPFAYLQKPFREIDLNMAIELAFRQLSRKTTTKELQKENLYLLNDRFFIRTGNGKFEKVLLNELLYLKADRSYCNIITLHKKYILSVSLNHILQQIVTASIQRIHKSYAVNTEMIDGFQEDCVQIQGHQIPIGPGYRSSFLSLFNLMK